MNCSIIVTQNDKNLRIATYTFDDYRVAQAVCNILDNVNNVHKEYEQYNLEKGIKCNSITL